MAGRIGDERKRIRSFDQYCRRMCGRYPRGVIIRNPRHFCRRLYRFPDCGVRRCDYPAFYRRPDKKEVIRRTRRERNPGASGNMFYFSLSFILFSYCIIRITDLTLSSSRRRSVSFQRNPNHLFRVGNMPPLQMSHRMVSNTVMTITGGMMNVRMISILNAFPSLAKVRTIVNNVITSPFR